MARFGIVGPSYPSQSVNADCQDTINWYPEVVESGTGKSMMVLYPTPGTSVFVTLPGFPLRGQYEINGRHFAVSGTNFCEVLGAGAFNVIGQVANDLLPVSMVASFQQLLIVSAGKLYLYQLQTQANSNNTVIGGVTPANLNAGLFFQIPPNTFSNPDGSNGFITVVEFSDGFFFALLGSTLKFYISSNFDASSWTGLQAITVSVFSDNIVSMIVNHRQPWMMGRKRSVAYHDSGSSQIYDVVPGGDIENGISSIFGISRLDNSIFWWDRDERGEGIARRAQGYTPARVSNHAIEFAVQGYPKKATDVICYSYQDQGHTFWVSYFPSANKTWVYDVATGMWHRRQSGVAANATAHLSQNHAYAFGFNLVGDWNSGNIYKLDISLTQDTGLPIQRIRRAPVISTENKWIFHSELQIDMETGLGPDPPLLDGQGNPRSPILLVRWSDDSGHTWSNYYPLDAGQAGKFKTRAIKRRLGRSRNRVYEISTTDNIPWRIIDADLTATPGFGPSERMPKLYQKVT